MSTPNGNVTQEIVNKERAKTMSKPQVAGAMNMVTNGPYPTEGYHLKPGERRPLTNREREALISHIKAMTLEELDIVAATLPVDMCMKRIHDELDHAREFESMIKKAYDMKKE